MAWLNAQQATPVPSAKGSRLAAQTTPREGQADPYAILSMYSTPPEGEVVIEDFERFAIARLRGETRARGAPPWRYILSAPG